MNDIRIIFRDTILEYELIPFLFVILSVLIIIITTGILVIKELKKEGNKNEK